MAAAKKTTAKKAPAKKDAKNTVVSLATRKQVTKKFSSMLVPLPKPPKFSIPKSPGEKADLLKLIKENRLALGKLVEVLNKNETALEEDIVNTLPKSKQGGAVGSIAIATIEKKTIPIVKDWDALYKHLRKTGEFELLDRKLNRKAAKERMDAKKVVPGIGKYDRSIVSITAK